MDVGRARARKRSSIGRRPHAVNPPASARYNSIFAAYSENKIMEAEQLNSISNKLDDIAQRAAELRRYL